MKSAVVVIAALVLISGVAADCYMHNPRGSNNKLNDEDQNAQNQNRLFDSQNNAKGGMYWGPKMYYYAGSVLAIEYAHQHSCGQGTMAGCEMVFQYMCDPTLRDGAADQGANARQTYDPANADQANGNDIRGRHESRDWYLNCKARERNKGLFNADQNLNDNIGATSTRQNAGGTRYGTECPEERDYYPYWHPTPWRDLAVLVSNVSSCAYYQAESFNVSPKGECSNAQYNNAAACAAGGGTWASVPATGIPAPVCELGEWSRVNHNGNGNKLPNAAPTHHNHTFGDHWPAAALNVNCVLRIRYNISTADYDPWTTFADSNGNASPVQNDPQVDIGFAAKLQLALNTAQTGRTFQDRSHVFQVKERPANIPADAAIHNLNVRGRRGNIVQCYPGVEYDFVPERLHVAVNDYVHFQWTGSDYNEANQAGEGTDQTDRSNIMQLKGNCQSCNYPEALDKVTLIDPADPDHDSKVIALALLGQTNGQLNDAPPYWDGGLEQMKKAGSFNYMCSRNNNFSNRSQKGTIVVGGEGVFAGGAGIALLVGVSLVGVAAAAAGLAFYARAHPTSAVGQAFAKRSLAGSGPSVSSKAYSQATGMTRSRGGRSNGSREGHSTGSRSSKGGRSKGSRGSKGSKFTQATAFTRANR